MSVSGAEPVLELPVGIRGKGNKSSLFNEFSKISEGAKVEYGPSQGIIIRNIWTGNGGEGYGKGYKQ